jgi:hypothetical protein
MIVEIMSEDAIRVYGASPEDAQWNAAHFQREFIAERFKRIGGCHIGLANSNGKEYFCEIIFKPRWRRARDAEVRDLRGKHANGNNAVFVGFLRQLKRDEVLIDKVVTHRWGEKEEVVLCQKCYVEYISHLSRDDEEGDQSVGFVINNEPKNTVRCSVHQMAYILI